MTSRATLRTHKKLRILPPFRGNASASPVFYNKGKIMENPKQLIGLKAKHTSTDVEGTIIGVWKEF